MNDAGKPAKPKFISAPTGEKMSAEYSQPYGVGVIADRSAALICGCFGDAPGGEGAAKANADLIAEAFNVHTETGLTPRQLVEKLAASEASDAESLALYRRTRYRADQLAEQQGDLLLELKLLVNAIEAHNPAEAGPPTDDPYIESRLVFARAIIAKCEEPK